MKTQQKFKINPISKPRMTKRDRWHKRPATARYWEYKRQVKEQGITLPEGGFHVVFVLPMPKSWGRRKQDLMRGQPHQQRPDKDNLEKGLLDAVFGEDCRVWDSRVSKIWGDQGEIWISKL